MSDFTPLTPLSDPLSLECAAAKPNLLVRSSRDLGWQGLLLDQHRAVGRTDVFETRPTGDVTLVVAKRGRHLIQVFKQGRWHTATYGAGNAGLTPPFETTRMTWQALDPDNQFETLHLYLSGMIVGELAEEYRRIGTRHADRPLSALVFKDMMIGAVAGEVLNAMHREAPGIYAEQVARFICSHLLARHSQWWDPDDDSRHPPLLGDRQLDRVLDYMSARFREDLTLAELANEACISVHHFVRRFREHMGVTPFAYLTTLRLEAGKRMLKTSDMTIAEIAHMCGYRSPGSFSSAFGREVGSTPRDYRSASRLRSNRD
ncbi:helix-turn-helix transcriptional regulator (plasmid) [Skermanella sp. TT6]|uniref:Helix-turn-helix transcriptional regulator n=1 Tax=Skermanella cutis TaxID=2775420 RepID=A0ABX7BGC7_9PROT|nr:AraC family transcriptional regulator [Skermanella sp. TT6]QQP93096.1 helix-turn-helix transcriptional regulator [Skermanella sp. TT6]QQP93253.1 helix-turn-helix transcriptional regulator [Skermanella sp. TT6]